MLIDNNTLTILTVLGIDIAGAFLIFAVFMCIRGLRGDKKMVQSTYDNRLVTEIVFEDDDDDLKGGNTNRNINEDGEGGKFVKAATSNNNWWHGS